MTVVGQDMKTMNNNIPMEPVAVLISEHLRRLRDQLERADKASSPLEALTILLEKN